MPNKYFRPTAAFTPGNPLLTTHINAENQGWLSDQEVVGVLQVDRNDSRPIVFIPKHKVVSFTTTPTLAHTRAYTYTIKLTSMFYVANRL